MHLEIAKKSGRTRRGLFAPPLNGFLGHIQSPEPVEKLLGWQPLQFCLQNTCKNLKLLIWDQSYRGLKKIFRFSNLVQKQTAAHQQIKTNTDKKTTRQTQRQIQRQIHTHKYKNTIYTITKRSECNKSNVPPPPTSFWGTKLPLWSDDISVSRGPFEVAKKRKIIRI